MTCLIGLIQDGKTYLGADGYATTDDCERTSIICRKMFVSDNYVVAFAGHIRTGQLLYPESGFEFPDDMYQIPNAMYLWLREFEAIGHDETQVAIIQSNFLIATRDKIYEILSDMQISEIDPSIGYTALGGGAPYAMGSLYTTSLIEYGDTLPPKVKIQVALNAAAEYVKNVGPPYHIYSYTEAIKAMSVKKEKSNRTKAGNLKKSVIKKAVKKVTKTRTKK